MASQGITVRLALSLSALSIALLWGSPAHSATNEELEQRMLDMERRLQALEEKLDEKDRQIEELEQELEAREAPPSSGLMLYTGPSSDPDSMDIDHPLISLPDQERTSYRYGPPDRYFQVPGSKTALEFGGHIWLDAMYNTKTMANKAGFVPSSIPSTGGTDGGETVFSAGQSKFYVKSITPTKVGDVHTRLEFDLFQSDGSADFHLTHLWGEVAGFGAGQTFSNFMDITVFPNTLDYWGPNGMIFVRQPQLRYTWTMNELSALAFSLEDPAADITLPTGASDNGKQRLPDFVTSYRREGDFGHFEVAGILREISYDADVVGSDRTRGWGINASGAYKLGDRNRIVAQAVYGHGISRYMNDLCCGTVSGNDAVVKDNGDLKALPAFGGFVYYDHWWQKDLSSSFGGGYVWLDNHENQLEEAIHRSLYSSANIIWYPADPIKVGLELLYGRLEVLDGGTADNTRIQTSFSFKF